MDHELALIVRPTLIPTIICWRDHPSVHSMGWTTARWFIGFFLLFISSRCITAALFVSRAPSSVRETLSLRSQWSLVDQSKRESRQKEESSLIIRHHFFSVLSRPSHTITCGVVEMNGLSLSHFAMLSRLSDSWEIRRNEETSTVREWRGRVASALWAREWVNEWTGGH